MLAVQYFTASLLGLQNHKQLPGKHRCRLLFCAPKVFIDKVGVSRKQKSENKCKCSIIVLIQAAVLWMVL